MAKSITLSLALLSLFSILGSTLEVAPDSKCALKCIDDPKGNITMRESSATDPTMLACYDSDFSSTTVGKKFAECNSCMQTSGYADTIFDERDITWFKMNNRAAIDWCIFGTFEGKDPNTDVQSTVAYKSCNSKCSAISASIDYNLFSGATTYDFCDSNNGNFTKDSESCIDCLYSSPTLTVLGNILTTVRELCIKKPGKTFDFNENIYQPTRIAQVSVSSSTSAPSQSSPAATSSPTNTPTNDGGSKSSNLSAGVIAGIALGGLLLIILFLCAILLVLRRMKKKKNATSQEPKETTHELGQYHELAAPGAYADPGMAKYGHTAPPGAFGQQSSPAELGEQEVIAELGPTSPTTRSPTGNPGARSPLMGSSPARQSPRVDEGAASPRFRPT